MTTSTIYRVEHKDTGEGPYRVEYEHTGLANAHMFSDLHPTPGMESYSYWNGVQEFHRFGFDSLDKCKKWFKDFEKPLHKEGFIVRVYESTPDTVYVSPSGKQLYFDRINAKAVDTLSLINYSKYYQTN